MTRANSGVTRKHQRLRDPRRSVQRGRWTCLRGPRVSGLGWATQRDPQVRHGGPATQSQRRAPPAPSDWPPGPTRRCFRTMTWSRGWKEDACRKCSCWPDYPLFSFSYISGFPFLLFSFLSYFWIQIWISNLWWICPHLNVQPNTPVK
jgi:hypothetical protein